MKNNKCFTTELAACVLLLLFIVLQVGVVLLPNSNIRSCSRRVTEQNQNQKCMSVELFVCCVLDL